MFQCGSATETGAKMLTKGEMINILVDLHVLEQSIAYRSYTGDSALRIYNEAAKEVYRKHAIDSLSFHTSYDHYLKNFAHMNEIYSAVVDTLSYREALARSTSK